MTKEQPSNNPKAKIIDEKNMKIENSPKPSNKSSGLEPASAFSDPADLTKYL